MSIEVKIIIRGTVSTMNNAEAAVAAIRQKAEQSAVPWEVRAVYSEVA